MSGVEITGLIEPLNGGSFPVFEDINGKGGARSVADITARNAIASNFRKLGMQVTTQSDSVTWELIGGILDANWTPVITGATAHIIRTDLTDLATRDNANLPNGCQAYVISEAQTYTLDTANPLTTSSPLIVARGAGSGKWYRISRAYVVGNFTLWCASFNFGIVGFTPGQLLVSSAALPEIQLNMSALFGTADQRVITDSIGNIWVITRNTAFTIIKAYKFLLKDCLVSGTPTPSVTLTIPIPATTEALMGFFDKLNGLWVGNGGHGTFGVTRLVRYSQKDYQLSLGAPSTTLIAFDPGATDPATSNQQDGVLDGQGNLWCSLAFTGDAGGINGGIIMFSQSQLASGGSSVVPSVFWKGSNFGAGAGGVGHTSGLAISPAGLLWVTSIQASGGTLKAWDIRNPSSGNPAPLITLTCVSFVASISIAFDAQGNLWLMDITTPKVIRIPAASLLASGAVVADIILSQATFNLEESLTFPNNPDRAGLLPSGIPQ